MAAITWRSMAGNDLPDGTRLMGMAQQSMNGAFDGFNKILKDREAVDTANNLAVRENQTQDALAKIQQFGSPAEYEAALKSGLVADLMSKGAGVDRVAIRNAADARLGTLQQRDKTGIEYQNLVTDNKEGPILSQLKSAIYNKDAATVARLKAENPGLRNMDTIDALARNTQNEDTVRTNADLLAKQNILSSENSMKNDNTRTANDTTRLTAAAAEAETNRKIKISEQLGIVTAKIGEENKKLASSTDGAKAVRDALTDNIKDPDDLKSVMSFVNKAIADPNNKNLTVGQLSSLALGSKDTALWGSNQGNDLEGRITTLRDGGGFAEVQEQSLLQDAALRKRAEFLNGLLNGGQSSGTVARPAEQAAAPLPAALQAKPAPVAALVNTNGYAPIPGSVAAETLAKRAAMQQGTNAVKEAEQKQVSTIRDGFNADKEKLKPLEIIQKYNENRSDLTDKQLVELRNIESQLLRPKKAK